jgi:hypothetical protein
MISSREDIEAILTPPLDDLVETSPVYTNAIGFIRVRRKWFMSDNNIGPLCVFW